MLVIDLFSGLGGWSAAFKDRGHEVFTVDIDPRFEPDLCDDMFNVIPSDLRPEPDVILASPPCNHFSVQTAPRDWKERRPRNRDTIIAIGLVAKTLWLIEQLEPRYWAIENPRGMLQYVMGPPDKETYFATWSPGGPLKPTHIWGQLPSMEWPKPKEWEPCPSGANTGVIGKRDPAIRALLPYGLSEALCKAIERELEVE